MPRTVTPVSAALVCAILSLSSTSRCGPNHGVFPAAEAFAGQRGLVRHQLVPSGQRHPLRPIPGTHPVHRAGSVRLRAAPQPYPDQEQQQQQQQGEGTPTGGGGEPSEAEKLLRDAERLRLEAEKMDASLTLQKIAALEEKLSNNAWLEKQRGQTVRDLYEELRRLEMKVSDSAGPGAPGGLSVDEKMEKLREESLKPPPPAEPSAGEPGHSSSGSTSGGKPKNRNLPPLAGFDDVDLELYVPVARDVNKMAQGKPLNERIGLFRDAPELQEHFKQKIQKLILGPLEEIQELESLKQEYFESSSSKEKDALLKRIKQLEARVEENNVAMGAGSDPDGGIGYSDRILIPPDQLPPLTEADLEERYETIRALPDILVAVYLQRNGLYELPVDESLINIQVGGGGINVTKTKSASADLPNEAGEDASAGAEPSRTDDDAESESEASSFDLYKDLKLAIQMDYYGLQLQLLDQARIVPLTDEMRKDFVAAYLSLPPPVREQYVADKLGIDGLEAGVVASDRDEDVECVLKEILQPIDEPFVALSQAGGLFGGRGTQEPIAEPPEYNDVEFVDRSRYLEEFFPSLALLEEGRPSPEDVDLFMKDCLTDSAKKIFMVTSKPERVIGGYYIRGTNQMGIDESSSKTPNERMVEEVSNRLRDHPTLKDKIEFFYITDPSPPDDEDMELEVNLTPLFMVTAKDPKTMYNLSAPLTKAAVTVSGLVSAFFFSIGSCVLNPKINAGIEKALDSATSSAPGTVYLDIDWFFNLCLPLYFSFIGILVAHELAHRIVASIYKFDIGLPNVVPSLSTGLAGTITPLKSPPPSKKALFDFAIAGPIAGLTVSIGLLFVGLELTRQMGLETSLPVLPVDLVRSSSLGGGMVEFFLGKYTLLPDQGPGAFVELHPFAISGFIGCLTNSLALLPLGHTDGGRISLAMFGRRGAFIVKLFTTLILTASGLFGLDEMNILLAYVVFTLIWQRELETAIRNEVDELSFSRGLVGIISAILVGLILIPMTS